MAETITAPAYHDGLSQKTALSGSERIIINDNASDKTATATVLRDFVADKVTSSFQTSLNDEAQTRLSQDNFLHTRVDNCDNHILLLEKAFCDMGEFETERKALDAIGDIFYCSSNANCILHAHYSKAGKECNMVCIQSFNDATVRQFLFNRDKLYQRCIYFTDASRTEIQSRDDWACAFPDRLAWDADGHKYVPSLFGHTFNAQYTDAIPLATSENAGLMTAAQVKALANAGAGVASVNATLADSGGLTLMECVAYAACTITINGTEHSISARKPYRYTFPAGTAAITSFTLSDAAKSALRVFRLTGRKVEASGSVLSLYNCTALRRADLSALYTSARTSFASLFNHCPLEKAEGLSHLDTSKVTNMTALFQDCQIKDVDLSTWDTSACTNLGSLFCKCAKLTDTGDISQWDTSKVTTVGQMFYGCAALESLDLSGWDLSSCTELTNIFYGCTALKSLQLGAGWGKMHGTPTLDLSPLTAWTDGVNNLLLLYNRAIGGLGKMTIKLTASAYASLHGMGGVTYLNQAGYTVTK